MSELAPSPFTCAKCGKVAMWERLDTDGNKTYSHGGVMETTNGISWWLTVPCECGSQSFKVLSDVNPSKWVGSYGTNG